MDDSGSAVLEQLHHISRMQKLEIEVLNDNEGVWTFKKTNIRSWPPSEAMVDVTYHGVAIGTSSLSGCNLLLGYREWLMATDGVCYICEDYFRLMLKFSLKHSSRAQPQAVVYVVALFEGLHHLSQCYQEFPD